jgi:hypothetical protein
MWPVGAWGPGCERWGPEMSPAAEHSRKGSSRDLELESSLVLGVSALTSGRDSSPTTPTL